MRSDGVLRRVESEHILPDNTEEELRGATRHYFLCF